jgi:hypothetical protein
VTDITEDFVWPRDDETPATACAEAIKDCIYSLPDDTLTALTDIYIAARKAEREDKPFNDPGTLRRLIEIEKGIYGADFPNC